MGGPLSFPVGTTHRKAVSTTLLAHACYINSPAATISQFDKTERSDPGFGTIRCYCLKESMGRNSLRPALKEFHFEIEIQRCKVSVWALAFQERGNRK